MAVEIALINPLPQEDSMRELYECHENLGLGLIASLLKQHSFKVSIFDLRVHRLTEKEVVSLLIDRKVSLVGLSVNYATLPSALKIAQYLKMNSPLNVLVALGGEHVTYLDKIILDQYHAVDFIIRGEGEETFLTLSQAVRDQQLHSKLPGMSRIVGDAYVKHANRPPKEDLDDLPFADRNVAIHAAQNNIPIQIGLLAQRGCPFPCSFCNANRFLGNETIGTRYRSAANVVDEIETLLPLLSGRTEYLRFYDATFITRSEASRDWALAFCEEMELRQISVPFDVFIRSDSFDWNQQRDVDLLRRLRQIGMISTYLGVETGDETTLTVYNKKICSNQTLLALETLRDLGMTGSTNGIITFHQDISLKQIAFSIDFLLRTGMCTMWNIGSRAETLPGIRLSDSMMLRDRETTWDIANYEFLDKQVEIFYKFITNLKRVFIFPRVEDRLFRMLRDKIRIKSFFDNKNGISAREEDVQNDIYKIQRQTHRFTLDVIRNIENGERVKVTSNHSAFVNNIMGQLISLKWKYDDLISDEYVSEFRELTAAKFLETS